LKEDNCSNECGDVRIENGQERLRVAGVNGGAEGLTFLYFLANSLEYQYIGIDGHADGQDDARDTWQR